MMTDSVVRLENHCKNNKFGDPFYSTTIFDHKSSEQECHCTVLVNLYGYKQFLDEVGHGTSGYSTRQNAAENMLKKLDKVAKFPTEKAINNIKENLNYYYDNNECEEKISERFVSNSYKHIYGTKKHEADNQLDRMQKLQGDDIDIIGKNDTNWAAMREVPCNIDLDLFKSLNLQPKLFDSRKACNIQPDVELSKLIEPVVNKKLNHFPSLKKHAQIVENMSSENNKKNSLNIGSDEGEYLSIYHKEMNTFFGHDKKRQIQQEISQLNVELQLKDLATIGKLDGDCSYSSKTIEYYVNQLDEILLQINVGVETAVFIAHDGRFIRTIRVTTLPEIVEIEIGCTLEGLGFKALFDVIDKLRKLMT